MSFFVGYHSSCYNCSCYMERESVVACEEVEDEGVHLTRWLLLNKMASFRHEMDLQIRHIWFNRSITNVVLNSWKSQHIIFLPHYQQCWNIDFRICYIQLRTHRPRNFESNAAESFHKPIFNRWCTTMRVLYNTCREPATPFQNLISHTRPHR